MCSLQLPHRNVWIPILEPSLPKSREPRFDSGIFWCQGLATVKCSPRESPRGFSCPWAVPEPPRAGILWGDVEVGMCCSLLHPNVFCAEAALSLVVQVGIPRVWMG